MQGPSFGTRLFTSKTLLFFTLLFLPVQLGKHFWPAFSYVSGIRVDYLSPILYLSDIPIMFLLFFELGKQRKTLNKTILSWVSWLQDHPLSLLFLIAVFFGFFAAKQPLAVLFSLLTLGECVFFGVYIAKWFRFERLYLPAFVFGVIFESCLAVLQFLHQGSIGGMVYFIGERTFTSTTPGIANVSLQGQLVLRPYGTFPHPNVLAYYLLSTMPFIILYRQKRFLSFPLFGATIGIGSLAMILTLSRVAILLWFFILGYLVIHQFLKHATNTREVFLGFFCFLFFGSVVFLTPLRGRFLENIFSDQAIQERFFLLSATWKMIASHPFFGVGLQNFWYNLPEVTTPRLTLLLQPVHNAIIFLLAEIGIVGILPVIWFIFQTGRELVIKQGKSFTSTLLLLLFFCVVIVSMNDHYTVTLWQGQLLTAFLFGLFWSKNG